VSEFSNFCRIKLMLANIGGYSDLP